MLSWLRIEPSVYCWFKQQTPWVFEETVFCFSELLAGDLLPAFFGFFVAVRKLNSRQSERVEYPLSLRAEKIRFLYWAT